MSKDQSAKNPTYERALSVFFEGSSPTQEQRARLPTEVDGLSVRRKAMIKKVMEATSEHARTRALKRLHGSFGLTDDVRLLRWALTPDELPLTLAALKRLEGVLQGLLQGQEEPLPPQEREKLLERLSTLEVRLFHEEALSLTGRCLQHLRALS